VSEREREDALAGQLGGGESLQCELGRVDAKWMVWMSSQIMRIGVGLGTRTAVLNDPVLCREALFMGLASESFGSLGFISAGIEADRSARLARRRCR
jgi:hypothetical protein